jgi:hypothetical protein
MTARAFPHKKQKQHPCPHLVNYAGEANSFPQFGSRYAHQAHMAPIALLVDSLQ